MDCRRTLVRNDPRRVVEYCASGQFGAARVQSRPHRIARLLGATNHTAAQAEHGCAYNLGQRPYPIRRPRPIRLAAGPLQAAAAEIDRLMQVCGAVEYAPDHDRDKALSESSEEWEKCPSRVGRGPPKSRSRSCLLRRIDVGTTRHARRRKPCAAPRGARSVTLSPRFSWPQEGRQVPALHRLSRFERFSAQGALQNGHIAFGGGLHPGQ
jgi:hypothetical protein